VANILRGVSRGRNKVGKRRIIQGTTMGRSATMSQQPKKNRVTVKIYDEEYTMRGTASPEYMRRLADYVDEKMKQIGQANSRLGINKVAVLTSVNLADELFRLRKEVRELENMLKKKSTK
jgi:cell division protein ZapA